MWGTYITYGEGYAVNNDPSGHRRMSDGDCKAERVGDQATTPTVVLEAHVVMYQFCREHRTRPTIKNLGRKILGLSERVVQNEILPTVLPHSIFVVPKHVRTTKILVIVVKEDSWVTPKGFEAE